MNNIVAWDEPRLPDGAVICNENTARALALNLGLEIEVVDHSED